MTAFVAFWTFWSFGELYYEGWGMPFPQPLAYLIPFAVALALGAATLAWPRVMGVVILVLSIAFYGWAVSMNLRRWGFSWGLVLSRAGMAAFALVGGTLFIVDGTIRARRGAGAEPRAAPWWRRRLRWLEVVGVPLATALVMSAINIPLILMRYASWDSLAFYGVPPIGLKTGRETGARHATGRAGAPRDRAAAQGMCGCPG